MYGPGLWSTMLGYLAVEPDGNTVRGLRFYEHAETPGLGDQIDKPAWRALWAGKQLYGRRRRAAIDVITGLVAGRRRSDSPDRRPGRRNADRHGVSDLVRYWTGPTASARI